MNLYEKLINHFLSLKPYERIFDIVLYASLLSNQSNNFASLLKNSISISFDKDKLTLEFFTLYNKKFYYINCITTGNYNSNFIITKIRASSEKEKFKTIFLLKKDFTYDRINDIIYKYGILSKEFLNYLFEKDTMVN